MKVRVEQAADYDLVGGIVGSVMVVRPVQNRRLPQIRETLVEKLNGGEALAMGKKL